MFISKLTIFCLNCAKATGIILFYSDAAATAAAGPAIGAAAAGAAAAGPAIGAAAVGAALNLFLKKRLGFSLICSHIGLF
jgi:hypothetical protein